MPSVYASPRANLYRVKTGNVRWNKGVSGPQQYVGTYNYNAMKRRRNASRSRPQARPLTRARSRPQARRPYVSVYARPGANLYRVKTGNVRWNKGVSGPQQFTGTYNWNAMRRRRGY